jgi:uncharacterized protein
MPPILKPLPLTQVKLTGGLLRQRQDTVLDHSLRQQHHQCLTTGRIDALRLKWTPESRDIPKPHPFWDSDLAKWIESAAYALTIRTDPDLEAKVDAVVAGMAAAQRPDGYLNSYYQAVAPDKTFTNLRDNHELYCAGHLIEAAVAYFQTTGKRRMLDVLCHYADHIAAVFGPKPGQLNGYDGHEEIELALVKLADCTGQRKYLDLARFFIDARGTQPHFFDAEARARGEKPDGNPGRYEYFQAHKPVREQHTVDGHSVRQLYLLAGVADVGREFADKGLLAAARKAFDNCVNRRMYLTGGVGSTRHGERFTYDFDLPNESAYAETCASIALIFFAHRMLNLDRDARYADAIETALYNTCLAGMSLDGKSYFYANYLATDPRWHDFEHGYKAHRQGWFDCACCPPNLTRLLAAVGAYAYSHSASELVVNLYTDSTVTTTLAGTKVSLSQKTDYPWDGKVRFTLRPERPETFTLSLRLPGWCDKPSLTISGRKLPGDPRTKSRKGYFSIKRLWKPGDTVELDLPMPPRRLYTDVRCRNNTGHVALARGPLVYCLEAHDNGTDLAALLLPPKSKLTVKREPKLLGGVTTLLTTGLRERNIDPKSLYTTKPPGTSKTKLKFIPYYAWANRGPAQMSVWVREAR